MRLLYFAYGLNLDTNAMMEMYPYTQFYSFAVLKDFCLCFKDGYPSVEAKGDHFVEGVLYNIALDDLKALDKQEGYPFSSMRSSTDIITDSGKLVKAMVYTTLKAKSQISTEADNFEYLKKFYYRYGFDKRNLSLASS